MSVGWRRKICAKIGVFPGASSANLIAIRRIAEVNRLHLHVAEIVDAVGLETFDEFGEIKVKGRVVDSFRRTQPGCRFDSQLPPKKGEGRWFGASPNRFGEPTYVAESVRLPQNGLFKILFSLVSIDFSHSSCQNFEFCEFVSVELSLDRAHCARISFSTFKINFSTISSFSSKG